MAAMTNVLENKLIDFLFRGQALGLAGASAAAGTGPTNLYIGLFTANPTDSTTGTEVSGNNYARVTVASTLLNWKSTQNDNLASTTGTNGTTSNTNPITFSPNPSNTGWGTVTGMGIFDSLNGGNLLFFGALTNQKVINVDDVVSFPTGSLTVRIDD